MAEGSLAATSRFSVRSNITFCALLLGSGLAVSCGSSESSAPQPRAGNAGNGGKAGSQGGSAGKASSKAGGGGRAGSVSGSSGDGSEAGSGTGGEAADGSGGRSSGRGGGSGRDGAGGADGGTFGGDAGEGGDGADAGAGGEGAFSGFSGSAGAAGANAGSAGSAGSGGSAGGSACVEGATEICNGLDDDCNQIPDDGLGSTTCGFGDCQVTVPNCDGGVPQVCVPAEPTVEVCDGADNDCDGTPDNGLGNTTCGEGECLVSIPACVEGVPADCVPGDPSPETCNELDDDCDGTPDNGFSLGDDVENCGFCGNACGVANANEVCSDGACGIASCEFGWVNTDTTYENGCECQNDATDQDPASPTGDNCSLSVVSGTLNEGATIMVSGKIATTADEDWYQFSFVDALDQGVGACDPYRPNITFSSNPGNAYRFIVYGANCSPYATCNGAPVTDFKYYTGVNVNECCWHGTSVPGATICSDQSMVLRVRVLRTSGASCDTYTLLVRNGP